MRSRKTENITAVTLVPTDIRIVKVAVTLVAVAAREENGGLGRVNIYPLLLPPLREKTL
jgi:transcriptional regulator with GAF, ATPase, and Fis domain